MSVSDVTISVSGLPFGAEAVSGINLEYDINQPGVAQLSLALPYLQSTSGLAFLCNPDQYKASTRNSPVTIDVKAKTGCIKFEGFFDGLSFNQSLGSMNYSAVIKSNFFYLDEVFPKFIGVDPSSLFAFKRVTGTIFDNGNTADPYEAFRGPLTSISADFKDKTIVEGIVSLLIAALKSQSNASLVTNMDNNLLPVLKLLEDARYKKAVEKAVSYLEAVDYSFVTGTELKASRTAPWIIEQVLASDMTVWQTLVTMLNEVGCMVVPGNSRLFVVPQSMFNKMSGISTPGKQQKATSPNVAFPADYNNLSVNDVGRKNIRACFIYPIFTDSYASTLTKRAAVVGAYPTAGDELPDDGSVGIRIFPAPQFLTSNIDALYMTNQEIINTISTNKSLSGDTVDDPEAIRQKFEESIAILDKESTKLQEKALNYFAKLKFLQEKYGDRMGNVTMEFKPSWVPGATGCVYSRSPGLFHCFFVSNVVHSIQLGNGSSGSATTSINFKACRFGGSIGSVPGVDNVELYNYNTGKMTQFMNSWLSDVGGKAK